MCSLSFAFFLISPVFAKDEPVSDSVEINLDALEEIDGGETIDEYVPPPMFSGGQPSKKSVSPVWVQDDKDRDDSAPPSPGKKPVAKYAMPSEDPRVPNFSEYTHIIDGTPNLMKGGGVYHPNATKRVSLPTSGTKKAPAKTKKKKSPVFVDDAATQQADFEIEQLEQPTAEQILAKIDVKQVEAEELYDAETDNITLVFQKGAIVPDAAMKAELDAKIVPKATESNRPVMIESYSSASSEGEGTPRRLSLARALGIQDYLISRNIPANKVEVRPFGAQIPENKPKTPPDRVDIYLMEKANH